MEVLPCPLCGNPPKVRIPDHTIRMDGAIECWDCNLLMEISHCGPLEHSKPDEKFFQEALEKWNHRV